MRGVEYLQSNEKRSLDIALSTGALTLGAMPLAVSACASMVVSHSTRPKITAQFSHNLKI